ncbi:MAG TPA: ketopantoate reductase C-terminal domain-containing protein, partial [Afipia sp.]
NVIDECEAVARALGIPLPDTLRDTTLALAASMPEQYSSTAQDLARGKPTEIDYLNGHVVRKGAALGLPTPTNLALQVMVKAREAHRMRSARAP